MLWTMGFLFLRTEFWPSRPEKRRRSGSEEPSESGDSNDGGEEFWGRTDGGFVETSDFANAGGGGLCAAGLGRQLASANGSVYFGCGNRYEWSGRGRSDGDGEERRNRLATRRHCR